MLTFANIPVPSKWIKIIEITKKDGTPINEGDALRNRRVGRITLCWAAGGPTDPALYFRGGFRMDDAGTVYEADFAWLGHTSPGSAPVEETPGVFSFTSNTSIYRFRFLTDEEEKTIADYVSSVLEDEIRQHLQMLAEPPSGGFPAS